SDEIQDFYENNFGYPIVLNIDNDFVNPNDYSLSQNYPNPFNPTTIISYQIPQQGYVTLKVFDVLGKEVATLVNQEKSAGNYEVSFDAYELASGVYIYRMKVNDFIEGKKMVLVK
ncbi:MAG: T9SS type A sorting domain-containing protein, partial [Ignavibacteriaceae bacterium]